MLLNFFARPQPIIIDYDPSEDIVTLGPARTMLERNIDNFRQVRDAHSALIEELDIQIAERQEERRQALATVAMCDAALAAVK